MRAAGFEGLKELLREAKVIEPSQDELQVRVKRVFKKAIDSMKEAGDRPELVVGKKFLEEYYREHGIIGMEDLLSKLSLLIDKDGLEYLVSLKLIKKKS